jgi:phosphatidylglycerophosphate synthase
VTEARRQLKTRNRPSAAVVARRLRRQGIEPNQISVASIVVAAAGAACLVALPHVGDTARYVLLTAAAICIQLRLLANLLDGMVAIEGGRQTPTGLLFNEIPDRVADVLFLVAAGYAVTWIAWGDALGWAAALAAVLTAYVRLLGGAVGVTQHFCGPMAKQHRMALLTAACLGSLIEVPFGYEGRVLTVALGVITLGAVVTFARRLRLTAQELRNA